MAEGISVEMMSPDFILWRCLHDGPLSKETIDRVASDALTPGTRFRARNKTLIAKLSQVYGTTAVLARSGEGIVGMLRFYPKAVWEMASGSLCFQQEFPAGPKNDFHEIDFPCREELEDLTLKIHCLMVVSPGGNGESLRHKGIATRMVEKLVDWAQKNEWEGIEAEAFEDLPVIYDITGSAGRTFWERLGFRVVDRFPHPHLIEPSEEIAEFIAKLEEQAVRAGMDTEKAKDSIIMRLDLAR